jgi:DNA/RNA-binding domain of Phe-tRNA-synthetase-like protein
MFIKINKAVFERKEDLVIGVVVAEGINNAIDNNKTTDFFADTIAKQREALKGQTVKSVYNLEQYHAAMRSFGINPSKYQISIEALLNRISKGGNLVSISPVVDLANAVSLKYLVPLGVHDVDSLADDLEIRFSNSGDSFDDSEDGYSNESEELVYASGNTIRTRKWIWRQMPVGKINEKTANIVFPVDGFCTNLETVFEARDFLAASLKNFFDCETRVGVIYKNSPCYKISDLPEDDMKVEEINLAAIKAAFEPLENSNEDNKSVDKKEEVLEDSSVFIYYHNNTETPGIVFVSSMERNKLVKTRSEARRLIQQRAVKINGKQITDINTIERLNDGDVVQIGKRHILKAKKE